MVQHGEHQSPTLDMILSHFHPSAILTTYNIAYYLPQNWEKVAVCVCECVCVGGGGGIPHLKFETLERFF
jgi:hypothetical protein